MDNKGCRYIMDEINGDGDCDYDTNLLCEDCKYGLGRKNPKAKCNQRNDFKKKDRKYAV